MAVNGRQEFCAFWGATTAFYRQLPQFFLVLFLAAGCARIAPGLVPLAEDERAQVLSRYSEYLNHLPHCAGIEADVRLRYQSIFKDASLPGVLLAKAPADIKVMGLGPLGQPLLIFSLHDGRFTLIDVQGQKGYFGRITASKVANLLPLDKLAASGLYALLTGAPAIPMKANLAVSRLPEQEQGRYLLTWPADQPHKQIVFNLTTGRVEAFRLLDAADRILLEIRYSPKGEERCGVPAAINISGSMVRGTVECTFERVFSADSLATSEFALSVPEGFSMEEVR